MEGRLSLFWRTAIYQDQIYRKDCSLATSTWEMALQCFTRKRTKLVAWFEKGTTTKKNPQKPQIQGSRFTKGLFYFFF